MSKVEAIEEQIEKLSPDELAAFRLWYEEKNKGVGNVFLRVI